MRFKFRDWVYIGLFGALWASADTRIGPLLVFRDVSFFSSVLAATGILRVLTGLGAGQTDRGRQLAAENFTIGTCTVLLEGAGRTGLG